MGWEDIFNPSKWRWEDAFLTPIGGTAMRELGFIKNDDPFLARLGKSALAAGTVAGGASLLGGSTAAGSEAGLTGVMGEEGMGMLGAKELLGGSTAIDLPGMPMTVQPMSTIPAAEGVPAAAEASMGIRSGMTPMQSFMLANTAKGLMQPQQQPEMRPPSPSGGQMSGGGKVSMPYPDIYNSLILKQRYQPFGRYKQMRGLLGG